MFNLNELEEKLKTLTGYDFETAEKQCRKEGDLTPDIAFSKNFSARLIAKAMGMSVKEVKSLNIKEYTQATTTVTNFLFGSLAEDIGPAVSTEE